MKSFHLLLFFLCLVELYAQRTRTVTNQPASTDEPRPVRTRGRSRFIATEELAQVSEQPERTTSNRRASARTRINSNSPKVAADRRARPIEISTKGYAVEEINNESPIDSFVRQSRPRVLTGNQFEASTPIRRPNTYEASTPAPADVLPVDELGFGSTARAILQARGEPLPAKTTTPIVDEQYLLTNFGNTIRTLAGSPPPASRSFPRNDIPIQRATPLRSEVPILDQEDIPVRRTSLRAEPLPSLRNSEINLEREPPARTRNGVGRGRLAEGRTNARLDSERRSPTTSTTTTEKTIVEEYVRFNPETDAPEVVHGLEQETATETQSFVEIPIEDELPDEEDVRKSTVVEIFTPRSTYSPPTTEAPATSRRNGGRSRFIEEPSATTAAPRSRGSRTRATRRPEESKTSSNARARISRRRFDDAEVAESRYRGPSVFTAEQYQDVTSRSRSGRKIDSRFEVVPTRAAETPTVRSRSTGRRATTAGPTSTERTRGRARSRSEPTSPSTTRPTGRRASLAENNVSPASARRLSSQEEIVQNPSRSSSRRTNIDDTKARKANNIEEAILNVERGTGSRSSHRRGSNVDNSIRKRVEPSRSEPVVDGNSRVQNNNPISKTRGSSNRNNGPTRHQAEVVEETTIYYGEKSRKTDAPQEITTAILTEKPVLKNNKRSRSRFPDTPPSLDESKLEILPLFERETKATNSVRSRGSRSRSSLNKRQGVDHLDASATENDVKFVEKPTTSSFTRVTVSRTESFEASTSRSRLSTRVASSSTTEVPNKRSSSTRAPVTTTTTPETTTRKITMAPPVIKESVVAEINQVTSKSTITRRKKVSKAKAAEIGSRGSKKADIKLSDVQKKKTSEEDIGEEDNYPEPFKALIQAKKLKDDSKPPPRITGTPTVQTSTPRVIVTSASIARGSSTARSVTTTVAPRKLQELNELINDTDNELDPPPRISSTTTLRPTRSRQLPKFSEKPKQKNEKTKFSPSKPTSTPRKSHSTKSYSTKSSAVHHPRRKALRSTAVPPPTTPLSVVDREAKFSAKFIKKENNGETQGKAFGGQFPKGLYSSKKNNENEALEEKIESKLDVSLIQSANAVQPIKKFNASRYSSRYRSDISTRSSVIKPTTSAPFYIPTIPTPAYVPTVPTVTPSVTPVDGIVAVNDADLGVEVISFDDPSNTIPSADLVNGEYLTTDKNLKLSPTVKDGTTEKPVSIIERIINSITLISTTEAPNTPLNNLPSPTTTQASGNSAILKLAAKKLTTKDKTDVQTNIIETITSEKPTTIIEKIRSSLSAIQTNEVGNSDTSSTPLSTVTKYSAKYRGGSVDSTTALPAPLPLSTTVNSLSVFDEIDENEVLEENTIGKLLNILNGLVSTESPDALGNKLVVVTPKNLNSGFVATTFSPQEPIEAITLSSLSSTESIFSTELPSSTLVNTQSTISETTKIVNNDQTSTISDDTTSTTALPTTTGSPTTEAISTIIPESSTTSSTTRYTETPTSTSTDDISISIPSTIPSVSSFKVSPGSVSVFSANDLINYITPDDNLFNTVTIASRGGFDFNNNNNVLTSTTPESVTSTTTLESTTNTESSTTAAAYSTTTDISSTTEAEMTTTMLTPKIPPTTISSRFGKILSADVGEPLGNNIDVSTPSTTTSTTPDYFIFAVLNNNTILRKRPPTVPNKEVPFVIVGLLPNNTVVRKYPNGTLIPMDPIIKVRGFDTRPNPPPLVEITSNQVTDTTNGMSTPDNNAATVDSNRMARLLSTEQRSTDLPRIIISSTTVGSTSSSSTSTTGKSTVSSTSSTTTTPPSSTFSGTTFSTSTIFPITATSSTTEAPKRVEIIAVPGETRISKSQATTTPSPESTFDSTTNIPSSTLEISTDQIFSSTMRQSTETIPTNLGDFLNGRTVDALNNLINPEPSTKLPNYKNLQLNQYNQVLNIQDLINRDEGNVVYRWKPVTKTEYRNIKNSITSTLPTTVTISQSTLLDSPFTSPMISTERTTFFPSSSDTLLSSTLISTLMPVSSTSIPTTQSTTTTTEPTTTTLATTTSRKPETTTNRLTTTARPKTTTGFPTFAPSTILPTILTTLFPNLLRGALTTPISPISSSRKPLIGAEYGKNFADGFEVLSVAGSTARPTTVLPQTSTSQRISTSTTPITTTTQSTTTISTTTTTTTSRPTITTTKRKNITNKPKTSESGTPTPSTKEETDKLFDELKKSGKLKNLNEEQRKNLEEIERIEKEQAELLKQLSLLTTMFGGPNGRQPSLPISGNPVGGSSNSLANRIISMAIERDKSRPTSDSPPTSSTTKKPTKPTTKRPNSIQDQLPITQLDDTTKRVTPSLEDVLKQYNLNGLSTELPLTSTYGKTDEAVLAAILKQHGIGPTTPKVLGDKVREAGLFDESTTTTKKPKPKRKPKSSTTTTTRPPLGGRLMQGLNWLLDILDPPTTTKKPASRRAKPKTPKPAAAEEELLTNQPTRITPMITAAPVTKPNLSQEEIKGLIKQLEEARKNPNAVDQLDLTRIKSLQNLINVNEGVEVTHTGQHGATSRATPRPKKSKSTTEKDPFLSQVNQKPLASTISTLSVSNSIDDDVELISTTTRTRVMPPVSLNPIPGIDDNSGDSVIRGNLLTAAVNVTKAISSFLGSAIQGARKGFQSLIGSGSAMVGNIANTSAAAG